MKTLQEKYNAIQEDNFSKAQFKRDAIMECSNLVTHFNSYEDIVNILINRGVLTEAKKEESAYSTASPADHIAPDVLDTGIKFECDKKHGTLDVSKEEYEKCREVAIKNLSKDVLYYVKQDSIQLDEPGEKMEKVKLNEETDALFARNLKAAGHDYRKMYNALGDAVAAEEGLEDASAEELKIYAQIALRLGDNIDVVNAFEYLENLPNYRPEFTPDSLRNANEETHTAQNEGMDLEDVLAQAQAYAEKAYPALDAEDIGDFIQLHGQEIIDGDDLETSIDNFVQHNFELDEKIDTKLNIKEDVYGTLIDQLTQMGLDSTNAKFLAGLAKMSVNIGTVPAIMALIYKNRNNPLIKKGLQKIDPDLQESQQYSTFDIQDKFPDRAFDIQKAALKAVGATDVRDAYSKSAGDFEQALYKAAHGNLEEDDDLGTPDTEDLYQKDSDYLANLKERKALKEAFRKLIKNTIEG